MPKLCLYINRLKFVHISLIDSKKYQAHALTIVFKSSEFNALVFAKFELLTMTKSEIRENYNRII